MNWRHKSRPPVAHSPGRRPIRAALLVGFGLILTLWVVSGLDFVRRVGEVERRTSEVQGRFMRTDQLLSTVQKEILLASVYLRDALLDTPDTAEFYQARFAQVRTATDQAVEKYLPVIDSQTERETFAQLRDEIRDFWETVLPALSWDTQRRALQTRTLLRERVMPRRQTIIGISERVQHLNRAAFDEQQAATAGIYRALRARLWQTDAAVLLLGLGVALLVTRHAGRLERSIQEQRVRERENAVGLQRLSAQLVHAQEEERRSIARELHDEVGQALTAIKVELAVVERALEPAARARNILREARAITDGALQTVRDLSQLLHPPMIDDLGLPATLEWYLAGFVSRTGVAGHLVQEGIEERLAPEIEVCLYRIAQEALTNIAKHARAHSCRVYLQRLPQTILLTVEDDGTGFDVGKVTASHARQGIGLLGVHERVAGFGGTFRLESSPGKGTRLTVEVPALPRPEPSSKAEETAVLDANQGAR